MPEESAAKGLWLPPPPAKPPTWRLSRVFTPQSLSRFRAVLRQGPPDDRTLSDYEDRFNACGIAFLAHGLSADDSDHFRPADSFHREALSLLEFPGGPTGEAARRMRDQYIQAVIELAEDLHCLYDCLTNGASMAMFLHASRESARGDERVPDPRVYLTARFIDYTVHDSHIMLRAAVQGFSQCLSGTVTSQLLMAYTNYNTGRGEDYGRTIRAGRPCRMVPSPVGMSNRFILPIEDSSLWRWTHLPDMATWPPLSYSNGPPRFSKVDRNPPIPTYSSDLIAENKQLREEKQHLLNEIAALRHIGQIAPLFSAQPLVDPLVVERDQLRQQVKQLRANLRRQMARFNDLTGDVGVIQVGDSSEDASIYMDSDDEDMCMADPKDNAPSGCVSLASYDRLRTRLQHALRELKEVTAARRSAEEKWEEAEFRCADLEFELENHE
ncbi:hypothetical protein FISHEDRAFT_72216 [Fistulina hepatica ATCC 64428]|uniref:Uncharacterized protein n=1 Tax=Fistulina hepatica ATCC 64428 TaxID=1128425 RepID=A0A0D7AFI6_9AGAR|nr:hypothetical protein FISHEDRAFT_72216 [Fistulina hepatica ATCC 64428]